MTPVSGDVIGKAIQTVPEIIRAAAQSLNGILALMILILGTLGYFTIRKAGAKERVGVFVMLFAGVVLFGVAVVQSQRRDLVPSKIATPSPTAQMPPAQPAAPPSTVQEPKRHVRQPSAKNLPSPAPAAGNHAETHAANSPIIQDVKKGDVILVFGDKKQ